MGGLAWMSMNPKISVKTVWILALSVLVLLGGVGAATARALHYADRVLPGTTLVGQDISGATRDEVVALVNEKVAETTIDIAVEDTIITATLAETGVTVGVEAVADAALAASTSLPERFRFSRDTEIGVVTSLDESVFDSFIEEVEKGIATPMHNATVTLAPDGASFVATEGEAGLLVHTEGLAEARDQAAATLSSTKVELEVEHTVPKVSTEQAASAAQRANELIQAEVTLTDGITDFTASAGDKAKWVALPTAEAWADPSIDAAKVKEWVDAVAASTNEVAPPGTINVNSQGTVVSRVLPGGMSLTVNNTQEIADGLIAAISQGQSFQAEFNYDRTEPEMTTVTIPDGAADHVYAAGAGEKWIDIDLTNNTVSAYEGRTIVQGPVPMVPGAPGTPTVTGTFSVYLKYSSQTMRGFNLDGTPYVSHDVPWVVYFYGNYALHGAPWRSSFGWSGYGGSHGCVNMPVDSAHWFYDWADYGITVVSHY